MDALLMCGGTGTRLQTTIEKPLYEIAGSPMIERALTALESSIVTAVHPVVTQHVPRTKAFLEKRGTYYLETPGNGYIPDLRDALGTVTKPVLTVATDLPLLHPDVIEMVIADHTTGSLTVTVPLARKRTLGLSHDTVFYHAGTRVVPTGVNIVSTDDTDSVIITDDFRLAVNVNHPRDARIAEQFL